MKQAFVKYICKKYEKNTKLFFKVTNDQDLI